MQFKTKNAFDLSIIKLKRIDTTYKNIIAELKSSPWVIDKIIFR